MVFKVAGGYWERVFESFSAGKTADPDFCVQFCHGKMHKYENALYKIHRFFDDFKKKRRFYDASRRCAFGKVSKIRPFSQVDKKKRCYVEVS